MPEIPGRHWIRLVPETHSVHPGRAFSGKIGGFLGVFLIHPGHPTFDLFQVGILAIDPDFPDRATVFVGVRNFDPDLLAKHQSGEALLGGLAEILFLLGGIDLVQPDLGLPVSGIQDSDRVAIRDTHDPTGKVSLDRTRQQQGEDNDEAFH